MTDDPPPPHCAGCADYRAIYGGFSLEVPYGDRLAKRASDLAARWRHEDALRTVVDHSDTHTVAS